MKRSGPGRILLVSAATVFIMAMTFSVFLVGVLGEEGAGGGTHGERDNKGFLEVRTSKGCYMVEEIIHFSYTSHFDENIIEPLPMIYNDDGETVEYWLRADVMPLPEMCPGQTIDMSWNPWRHHDVSEMPPGRYYVSFEHDGEEFISDFWIIGSSDTDVISDGLVLESSYIMGPSS